jgi:hypothetical protein
MSHATLAFISGLVLYNVFVFIGGVLEAIVIPKAYFTFFGAQHKALSLFILEAVTFAMPCFILSTIWSWLTLHWLPPVRACAKWYLIGIVGGWLYWQLQFMVVALEVPDHPSIPALLAMSVITPVWAILNALAVPLGLGFALLLAGRPRPDAVGVGNLVKRRI